MAIIGIWRVFKSPGSPFAPGLVSREPKRVGVPPPAATAPSPALTRGRAAGSDPSPGRRRRFPSGQHHDGKGLAKKSRGLWQGARACTHWPGMRWLCRWLR